MTIMMMMTASSHQLRPAPVQWPVAVDALRGLPTQVRGLVVEISSFMMMDVDMLDPAYSGEGLDGRDQQLHDDGCGHA